MNAHVISKLFLKRIAGKEQPKGEEKIGYYDIKEKRFDTMKIDSKNKELVIKDLHNNLELERSKLEDNFAKILDSLIDLPLNQHLLLEENKYDLFLKFYIFQAFTTINNFENNKNILESWLKKLDKHLQKYTNLSDFEFSKLMKPLASKIQGIEGVNHKLFDLIENKGIYFDKMQILKTSFIPIILNLENHKAFYTDKLFRIYGLSGNDLLNRGILPIEYEILRDTDLIENLGFRLTHMQIGSIDNNNLLIFLNNLELEEWNLSKNILPLSKIQNEKLEDALFDEKINFFSIYKQKPIHYIWFNNNDLGWIKEYFKKVKID